METPSGKILASGNPIISWQEQPLLLIRKTILSFLQGLFEEAEIGNYRWDPNLESTEIVITDETPITLSVVGKRPAITITRGTVAWGTTSLDTLLGQDSRTGQKKYTDLTSGTISINCCSRYPLESERIAWVVANHSWLLRNIFMKYTPIHEFGKGIQIGSVSPAGAIVSGDDEDNWVNTPVVSPFFMQVYGKVTPLNQRVVREIETKLQIKLATQTGFTSAQQSSASVTRGTIKPPSIRGRPIRNTSLEQTIKNKEP